MNIELLIILTLTVTTVITSGFLSFSEAAVMSLNKNKFNVYMLQHPTKLTVKALNRIFNRKSNIIMTIIILNTIINIGGSTIIGSMAGNYFSEQMALSSKYLLFADTDYSFNLNIALSFNTIFTISFTLLVLFFAEMIPKVKASEDPLPYALMVSIPLVVFEFVLRPIVFISSKIVSKFSKNESEPTVCLQEVKSAIKEANNHGLIKDRELDIINNTFKLSERCVKDLMLCKTKIEYIHSKQSILENQEDIIDLEHKRIIVIDTDSNDPVGVVVVKDLLQGILRKENKTIGDYMHPLLIVKENDSLSAILADFNDTLDHLALVKCNDGSYLGVLAVEDVLDSISIGFVN